MQDLGLPVIVAAFVIATALRVAQGYATAALGTTAFVIAPRTVVRHLATGTERSRPR